MTHPLTIRRLGMLMTGAALALGTCASLNRSITRAQRQAVVQLQQRELQQVGITIISTDSSSERVVSIDMSASTIGLHWLRDRLSHWEYSMVSTVVLPVNHDKSDAMMLAHDYPQIAFMRADGSRVAVKVLRF